MAESAHTEEEKLYAAYLIALYRELVAERYTYDNLQQAVELPPEIDRQTVDEIRTFFLQYVYPPADEREQLEAAFSHLEEYVSKPNKVWYLLGDMASAVMRFGLQLPKALRAGVLTLESYLNARRFEDMMLREAKEQGLEVPMEREQFIALMAALPRHKVEHFINEVGTMFNMLSDTKLAGKTIQIIEDVIDKMLKHPAVYTAEEVEGIKLGLNILKEGYELMRRYDRPTQREIVKTVKKAELQFLDEVYQE